MLDELNEQYSRGLITSARKDSTTDPLPEHCFAEWTRKIAELMEKGASAKSYEKVLDDILRAKLTEVILITGISSEGLSENLNKWHMEDQLADLEKKIGSKFPGFIHELAGMKRKILMNKEGYQSGDFQFAWQILLKTSSPSKDEVILWCPHPDIVEGLYLAADGSLGSHVDVTPVVFRIRGPPVLLLQRGIKSNISEEVQLMLLDHCNRVKSWPDSNGQLLIHHACGSTDKVVQKLITMYPNGCQIPDNAGFLPLHRILMLNQRSSLLFVPIDRMLKKSKQLTTFESLHNYENYTDEYITIDSPGGASSFTITFDEQTSTESGYDYIKFFKDDSHTEIWGQTYSGGTFGSRKIFPGIGDERPLEILSNKCIMYFHSDSSNVDWGYKFYVSSTFSDNTEIIKHIFQAYPEACSVVSTETKQLPFTLAMDTYIDSDVLITLFKQYPSVASEPHRDKSLLIFMIEYKYPVQLILEVIEAYETAAKEYETDTDRSPLHIAILHCEDKSRLKIIERLLAVHPDAAKHKDKKSETPFHALFVSSFPNEIINLLLAVFITASIESSGSNDTPASPVRNSGHAGQRENARTESISAEIKDIHPLCEDWGKTIFKMALEKPLLPTVLIPMIQKFKNLLPTKYDGSLMTPLHIAVNGGLHSSVIRAMIEARPEEARSADKKQMLPLHYVILPSAQELWFESDHFPYQKRVKKEILIDTNGASRCKILFEKVICVHLTDIHMKTVYRRPVLPSVS